MYDCDANVFHDMYCTLTLLLDSLNRPYMPHAKTPEEPFPPGFLFVFKCVKSHAWLIESEFDLVGAQRAVFVHTAAFGRFVFLPGFLAGSGLIAVLLVRCGGIAPLSAFE